MIAVHLSPGPRGYGVARDDETLIAYGMTCAQAVLTVNEGRELDPKDTGNHYFPKLTKISRRTPHRTFSHNEAQGPEDFMT